MARQASNLLAFNSQQVLKASAVDGKQTEWRVEGCKGLVLVCQPSGTATWWYYYSVQLGSIRKLRKVCIGSREAYTLHDARAKATELLRETQRGVDLVAEGKAKREALTFQQLAEKRLSEDLDLAARTRANYSALFKCDVFPAIGFMPAASVTREVVLTVLDKISQRGALRTADQVKTAMGSTFKWANKRGLLRDDPTVGLGNRASNVSRTRKLTSAELPIFLSKLDDPSAPLSEPMRIAIRLALCTGLRRTEVIGARLSELALDTARPTWTLPGDHLNKGKLIEGRTKNGVEHVVQLSPQAVALFRRAIELGKGRDGYVLPADLGRVPLGKLPETQHMAPASLSRAMRRFCNWAGIADLTVHDLRRTMATFLGSMATRPDVIRQVLNHVPDSSDVTSRVYNQAILADHVRAALEMWANHLDQIASGKVGELRANVVPLSVGRVA